MSRRLAVLLLGTALAATCDGRPVVSGIAKVVDGDSLEIGGTRIRLHAVDAPEARQTCRRHGAEWRCGAEATARLRELADGRPVACRQTAIDDYGRVVAVCRREKLDLAGELVAAGLARAYRRYGDDYVRLEAAARGARRGIWAGEHEAPWDWRRSHEPNALPAARIPRTENGPGGCRIKGNINRNGERIYHVPGSRSYAETQIDQPGERWFCTEEEARRAGWRAPRG